MTETIHEYAIAIAEGSGGDYAAVYVDGARMEVAEFSSLMTDWLPDEQFGWGAKPHTIRTFEAVYSDDGWPDRLEDVVEADPPPVSIPYHDLRAILGAAVVGIDNDANDELSKHQEAVVARYALQYRNEDL